MTCLEYFSLFKDVVVSLAAITGSVVAVKGLTTWRRQLSGQSEFDLSRKILVSLYRYRDAIQSVRNPAIWNHEMPELDDEKKEKYSYLKKRHFQIATVYEKRFEKVTPIRIELNANLLEAEAVWGTEFKDMFKSIYSLEHELFTCIRHYLIQIDPDEDEESKIAVRNLSKDSRDVMYASLGDKPDSFTKDLLKAIKVIEDKLRPKLAHKKI